MRGRDEKKKRRLAWNGGRRLISDVRWLVAGFDRIISV